MGTQSYTTSAYIFLGPELGKKQEAVEEVKKKFNSTASSVTASSVATSSVAASSVDESAFYAGETPISTIADILQNNCLFADRRIVIIKNAEAIKKKDEIDLLVSCIKNLDTHTAFILLSDEIRLAAGLEKAVPDANRKIFYEMFEREKTEWVRQFFKREGFNIDNDSIAAVLELVENNTAALKRECSRLMYFLSKEKEVTAEDIEKWLSHNREESAFTLFSRIAAGDLSKALESVSVMLAAKESTLSILAGLAWCFRKLVDYLFLLETGEADNFTELKKIGLSAPKARDDYAAASRRYDSEAAQECLALTAEYDVLLRSPLAALENILMDRYILSVMRIASDIRR